MSRTRWFALVLFFLLTIAPVAVSQEDHDDHEGHDHGGGSHDNPWAWAGVFELVAGETYTWTAARGANGKYADASMKLVAVKAGGDRLRRLSSADEMLHGAESHAEEFFGEVRWNSVTSGSMVQISDEVAFKMEFDDRTWMSLFYMQVASSGSYVFFAEHLPWEFENGFHFLRDEHGDDVDATLQEPAGDPDDDDEVSAADVEFTKNGSLGLAVLAAVVTALPGCLMIAVVAVLLKWVKPEYFPVMYSFASGAIFACAVFILLAEGLHLAGAGQDEVTGTWTWGVAIMLGWLIGMFIHHAADIAFSSTSGEAAPTQTSGENPSLEEAGSHAAAEGKDGKQQQEGSPEVALGTKVAVAGPVLFGDFWHNLVDGMVVGFACKSCSSSFVWTIVGATVAHEVPQEISDFFLLVTKAGMPWKWALLANSGTAVSAVIIGAIIAYEVDVSMNFEGLCLAFGGGVYLFVALTELADSLVHMKKPGALASLMRFMAFAFGAMTVGLVLLDHQHCDGGGAVVAGDEEADPHAGHNHR